MSRAAELNEQLKARIVMSAFQNPVRTRTATAKHKPLTVADVKRLQKKVTDLVSPSTKGEQERHQIDEYFRSVKSLLRRLASPQSDKDVYAQIFASQFGQIESLANAFDEFDQSSARAYEPIKSYLQCINRFLEDSGKELLFDAGTGALSVQGIRNGGSGVARDVSSLSSGERQILVLFTFLAFVARNNSVFIVDEPELSLHPKWQMEFMDAFLELKPKGTQLLLATHSPEIVGRYKERCIVVGSKKRNERS